MAITPIKPSTSDASFQRLYIAEDATNTSNANTGTSASKPSAFESVTTWVMNANKASYNQNFNPNGSGVSFSTVGGIALSCDITMDDNGAGRGRLSQTAHNLGSFPTSVTIVTVRNPYGVTNASTQYTETPITSVGCPCVINLLDHTQNFTMGVSILPTGEYALFNMDAGTPANNKYGNLGFDAAVGPETIAFVCTNDGTDRTLDGYVFRGGTLQADGNLTGCLNGVTDAGGNVIRFIDTTPPVGNVAKTHSRSAYVSVTQHGDPTALSGNLLSYAQWMQNLCTPVASGVASGSTGPGTAYPEPTKLVCFIGDSITCGWNAIAGVTYPAVFEAAMRASGVAVYMKAFPGVKARDWADSNAGTGVSDATMFNACVNMNRLTFGYTSMTKKVAFLALGTNDVNNTITAANTRTYLRTVAGFCRSAGFDKVGVWVPPAHGRDNTSNTAIAAIRLALRDLLIVDTNFDFVFDTDSECPEVCTRYFVTSGTAADTEARIQEMTLGVGFQQPNRTGRKMDGTNDTANSRWYGTDRQHPGPLGHLALGRAMARHSGLLNALGISVGASSATRIIPIPI